MPRNAIGLDAEWVAYFMQIVGNVSLRSTCGRRRIGAVLVDWDARRIVATGRNGVLPDGGRCDQGGCPRGRKTYDEQPAYAGYDDCLALHAEVAAWRRYAADLGVAPLARNLVMFVSEEPCDDCWGYLRPRVGTVVHDG